jgi:hypothetical protein
MEFLLESLAFCAKPIGKLIKRILPESLKKNFEPDSDFGNFCSLLVLVFLMSAIILAIRIGLLS